VSETKEKEREREVIERVKRDIGGVEREREIETVQKVREISCFCCHKKSPCYLDSKFERRQY